MKKLTVEDSIVKNIDPYKIKESTKLVLMVKSIRVARTEGMIDDVKDCMVDFGSDILYLHCGTNNFKKELYPQKIAQNLLKLAEKISNGGKRVVLISGIINRSDDFNAKVQR